MKKNTASQPLTKDQAFALVDAVMENDELAITASAFEDENGEWVFEASCNKEPDIEAFNQLANNILGGNVTFSSVKVDKNIDWVSKSLAGLKPVVAGGFYVYGSHDKANLPSGVTGLKIDAAQAFGTGHHETTTGCLEAIEKTLKHETPRFILDIGTGTGLLAIAIAKRTKEIIIASDIDPIAVKITKENAILNNVNRYVHAIEAKGVNHRDIAINAPYDLIVANILANPLIKLAPGIGRISNKGATIILSGILAPQATRVIAAYRQQGITLKKRIIKGEWATLILKKP